MGHWGMLAFDGVLRWPLVCAMMLLCAVPHQDALAEKGSGHSGPQGTADIQLSKKAPPEGGVTYRYDKDDCSISLSINQITPGQDAVAISGAYCPSLPYAQKLAVMTSMLEKVVHEGKLKNLRRVGPGPGDEICKGEIRKRLVKTTLDRLSDGDFMRRHPELVVGRQRNRLDAQYAFEEADAFREYKAIFERIGYALELEEIEGVAIDKIKPEERPMNQAMPREIGIPCNAMVYFRVQPNRPGPRK